MTMTDTADAEGSAPAVHRAGGGWLGDGAGDRQSSGSRGGCPEIKRRMLDAGDCSLYLGDFHYNGHLLLTLGSHPDCAWSLDKDPDQPRQRRDRTAPRRAVRHHLQRRARQRQTRANRRQWRSAERDPSSRRCRRTPTAIWPVLRGGHQRVHGAVGGAVNGARSSPACGAIRSSSGARRRARAGIAVYRDLARRTDYLLHLGFTEAGMGIKG